MKQTLLKPFNGTQPSKDCINNLVGRLIEVTWYNCEDMNSVEILLRYMRQRKIKHSIEFDEKKQTYTAIVKVKLPEPIKMSAIAGDDPAVAFSMCGAQLARLADL